MIEIHPDQRFDIKRAIRDVRTQFPVFWEQLKLTYPSYDCIWDRVKSRWLICRWLGEFRIIPIYEVETEDEFGCYADPGPQVIEWLQKNDVSHFASIDAFVDHLSREHKNWMAAQEEKIDQRNREYMKPFIDYLCKAPEYSKPTPLPGTKGWTPRRLATVALELDASRQSQGGASAP